MHGRLKTLSCHSKRKVLLECFQFINRKEADLKVVKHNYLLIAVGNPKRRSSEIALKSRHGSQLFPFSILWMSVQVVGDNEDEYLASRRTFIRQTSIAKGKTELSWRIWKVLNWFGLIPYGECFGCRTPQLLPMRNLSPILEDDVKMVIH